MADKNKSNFEAQLLKAGFHFHRQQDGAAHVYRVEGQPDASVQQLTDLLDTAGFSFVSTDTSVIAYASDHIRNSLPQPEQLRTFDSGATRDSEADKLDYEGFLSPLVLRRYAEYMNSHRTQADGKTRDSDNWQKGIPRSVYMKSMWRHFMALWVGHRRCDTRFDIGVDDDELEASLCAVIFNASGYLHEIRAAHDSFYVAEAKKEKDPSSKVKAAPADGPDSEPHGWRGVVPPS